MLVVSWFTRGTLLLALPLFVTAVMLARVGAVRVVFRGDELIVRNSFKTYAVPRSQITAVEVVPLHWAKALPQVAALRVAGPAVRTVKVYATASFDGERAIERFGALVGEWQHERLYGRTAGLPIDNWMLPEDG